MSKKILKPLLIGAAIIAIGVATGGISFVGTTTIGGVLGGAATVLPAAVLTSGLGGALLAAGAGLALSGAAAAFTSTPHATLSQLERLNATINPSAPRKFVFGRTAMATEIRYTEPSGEDQEYIDNIICVAAHRVASIEELWIDDLQAWSSTDGVMGKFAGYLTVNTVLEGTAGNTIAINDGSKWGARQRLTGCAYMHLRIKRTGNGKKAESPFVSGLSTRLTIIGNGVPVYDPRLDSTVPGGSGPQRISDQSTWSFDASGLQQGSNFALQALTYQLGWRINGKVSVGAGIPPSRLNIASYIQAANLCDETIALAAGGTQKRYSGGGVFGDDADPGSTLSAFANACNGALQDAGGKFKFLVRHNDLGAPAVDLTDDDILSAGTWEPTTDIDQAYNVVRGRWANPAASSLYQLVDYPEVRLDSVDGQDRVLTLDLPLIDDAARAQRIAKQVLERRQYQGKFTANFGARAWNAKVGDIVRVTLSAAGWVNKVFRVEGQGISMTGSCPMVLREEAAAIYAWDAEDRSPVIAAPPTVYDPTNSPLVQGINEAGTTANWSGVIDDNGGRPDDNATVGAPFGTNIGDIAVEVVIDDLQQAKDKALAAIAQATDALTAILEAQQLAEYRQQVASDLTHIAGAPAKTVLSERLTSVEDDQDAMAQKFDLLGAVNGAGTAYVLNGATVWVKTSPPQTFADFVTEVASSFGDITDPGGTIDARITAYNTTLTGPDGAIASSADEVTADYKDDMKATVADFAQALSNDDTTRAEALTRLTARHGTIAAGDVSSLYNLVIGPEGALAQSIETLDLSLNGSTGSITHLNQVLFEADGDVTAKSVIAIDADGNMAGIYLTATRTLTQLRMLFDSYELLSPTGTVLLYAEGDTVKMPHVEVDTLKNNTAVVPVAASGTSSIAGTDPVTTDTPTPFEVLSVVVTMPVPGWIEVQGGGQHAYSGAAQYIATLKINGVQPPEAVRGAGSSGIDGSFELMGRTFVDTPGDYTVTLNWNANTALTLNQRSLWVKGYPYTE